MLFVHLCLGLPSGLFPSGFPTSNLYTFLSSPFVPHVPPTSSSSTGSNQNSTLPFFRLIYAGSADRIGMGSSAVAYNSLAKVKKISELNSVHSCLKDSPKGRVLSGCNPVIMVSGVLHPCLKDWPKGRVLSG
jgi:hypothetical protein